MQLLILGAVLAYACYHHRRSERWHVANPHKARRRHILHVSHHLRASHVIGRFFRF